MRRATCCPVSAACSAGGRPPAWPGSRSAWRRSEEHTSELQSHRDLHFSLHDALPIYLWLTADATGNLLPSLGRMLGGWAAACLAGIAIGVAIGRRPLLAELAEPIVHLGRGSPP